VIIEATDGTVAFKDANPGCRSVMFRQQKQ